MSITGGSIFKSIGGVITGSLAQSIVKIAILAVFARLLTPQEFGVYNAALVVMGLVLLINELGIAAAIVQKIDLNRQTISTGFFSSIGLGIILTIGTFVSSGMIAEIFKVPELNLILKVVSFLFLIESFGITSKGILQREMKFKIIILIEFFSFFIGYACLGVLLAYLGFSYWSLIFGTMFQASLRTVLSLKYSKINFGGFSKKEFKELWGFGSGFTLARIFNYSALNSDNFIISRFIGSTELGFYGRAYQIMVFPSTLIGGAMDKVFYPTFANFNRTKDQRTNSYYTMGLKGSILFSNLIACIFFFNSFLIVDILLGDGWEPVAIPLKYLSVGLIFRLSYKMNISIIRSHGWVLKYALSQFFYFLLVLLGSYLVWNKGIGAISIIVSFSIAINYCITLFIATRSENLDFKKVLIVNLKAFAICATMWIVAYFIFEFLNSIVFQNSIFTKLLVPFLMAVGLIPCLFLDKTFLRLLKRK